MSHVDEGLIHAWLDGALLPGDPECVALEAHVEACDECRARVEAERTIRDRAAAVLRSVAPDATRVEPYVCIARTLSEDYDCGYWEFYGLSNGAFYMAPAGYERFNIRCENGWHARDVHRICGRGYGRLACIRVFRILLGHLWQQLP